MPVFVIFIKAWIVKKHKCLLQMNRQRKLNKFHLIECYKTLKMETILSFKNIQQNPDGLMLAKTGQRQRDQWCMILHMAPQKAEVISPGGRDGENAKMLVKGINFPRQMNSEERLWSMEILTDTVSHVWKRLRQHRGSVPFFFIPLPLRVFRYTHRYTCVLLGRRSFFHWFSEKHVGTHVCNWGDGGSFFELIF